jgi:orotate phosphoribosyltransferase
MSNNTNAVRVTMQHVRAAGYCVAGTRVFCQRYGLDFRELVHEGLPIHALLAIDDAMAHAVVALAVDEHTRDERVAAASGTDKVTP